MDRPRKPYTTPKLTERKKTPELERLLAPAIREFFRLHPERYHPEYNPAGWEGAPVENEKKNVSGI